MPAFVNPFAALRPEAGHAAAVAAPPYDVVSTDEARRLASGRPNSFLRISRPEIDFPAGATPDADAIHARAAENLERLRALGLLVRDDAPGYYAYRMQMGDHRQTGVAVTIAADAYAANRFRKHESTRPDKETDRVRNMLAVKAQTGPVLSAYRARDDLRGLLQEATAEPPLFEVEGPHAVRHTVWRIAAAYRIGAVSAAFDDMDALYIADGHHRSAAGARVAAILRAATAGAAARPEDPAGPASASPATPVTPASARPEDPPTPASASPAAPPTPAPTRSSDYILSIAFPHDELRILGYNRVVRDLNGLSARDFLARVAERFEVEAAREPVTPARASTFGLFVDGRWHRLAVPAATPSPTDPVASLDVSLLHDRILAPILDVGDPRTDPRVDFVGGVRGPGELEARVRDSRAAVAFALFPTRMEQLMAVADAGRLMPPKSTWFEPKLADGLLTHVLDQGRSTQSGMALSAPGSRHAALPAACTE